MRTAVCVRVRPCAEKKLALKVYSDTNAITAVNEEGQNIDGQAFSFDRVYDSESSSSGVYSGSARHIVEGFVRGISGTIFAYGATSSGKTFTMLGGTESRGILDMAAETIFMALPESATISASFVEVYNEVIRDLISEDSSNSSVQIRGNRCCSTEKECKDHNTIMSILKKGLAKRAVSATAMNEQSSRSHSIFTLSLKMTTDEGKIVTSALNLVDLAGSESVKHTGASGQRQKEGAKINQSLLSLGKVIHALSQGDQQQLGGQSGHISYRDSKLTRLLQPSLSGEAQMSVICCVTPSAKFIEQTLCTLQFASRCMLVTTSPVINEKETSASAVVRLQKEVTLLRGEKEKATYKVKQQEEVIARYQKQLGSTTQSTSGQLQQTHTKAIMMRSRSTGAAAASSVLHGDSDDEDDGDTVPLGAMMAAGTLPLSESMKVAAHAGAEAEGVIDTNKDSGKDEVLQELQAKLAEKEADLAALVAANRRGEQELQRREAAVLEREKAQATATGAPEVSVEEFSTMRSRVHALETELRDAEELLEKIEQENADLTKDLEEAHSNAQEVDDERRECKVQISALEKELERAIVDLGEVADEAKEVSLLQAALAASKKENEEAMAEVASLELEKEARQAFAEAKSVGESEAMTKRLQQLQSQVAFLEQEKDKSAEKIKELHGEAKAAERREDTLMKDLDDARASEKKNKQMKDRTEALSARVASLETSLDETRTNLANAEEGARKLESQLKQAQEASTTANAPTKEEENGNHSIEKDNTIAILTTDLAETQQRLRECQEELSLAQVELGKATETSKQLQQALDAAPAPSVAESSSEREKKAVRDAAMKAAEVMELEGEVAALKKELEDVRALDTSTTSVQSAAASKTAGEAGQKNNGEISTFEKDTLMGEMNAMMEQKNEFESRATIAEASVQELTAKLSLAEEQLDQVRLKIETVSESVRMKDSEIFEVRSEAAATREALIDSQKVVKRLEKQIETLESDLKKQEDIVVELDNDMFTLRQAAEAAAVAEEHTASVALATEVETLREKMKAKDARIEKLEKSKLTRENLDKIKAIKDEKTRLAKENKKLTRQLEEIHAGEGGATVTNKKVTALQLQLDDRSSQVEEYEAERRSLLQILEEHGVDATRLSDSGLDLDSSLDHSDLDIGSTLSRVLQSWKKKVEAADPDELRSLNEENVTLLQENRTLRRQMEREKRTSMNTSIISANTPRTEGKGRASEDKENRVVGVKRGLGNIAKSDAKEDLDTCAKVRRGNRPRDTVLTDKA